MLFSLEYNNIFYCMYFSSSPGIHSSHWFNRMSWWRRISWWNESGVSRRKESCLEGLVSIWMVIISQPSVVSRVDDGLWFFYLYWVILRVVKLVGKNAPWLPFIFACLQTCSLKSLSLIHSEVTVFRMSLSLPGVSVSIMMSLNHNMMIVL